MLLIHDRVHDGQQFPLTDLLKQVLFVSQGPETAKRWKILGARGYGLGICHLEDELDQEGQLEIDSSELIFLSEDPNQWFYELRVIDDELGIEFGVFDSSYLYLDGDEGLGLKIASVFRKVTKCHTQDVQE